MSLQIDLHDTELRWYSGETLTSCHKLKGVTLAGVQTKRFGIDACEPRIVRAVFKPGGAYPFFREPSAAFRNTVVSLEDIWGNEAQRLQDRLVEAPTADDIFRILGEVLIGLAPRRLVNHTAVSLALSLSERAPHRTSVASLAERAGLSRRRFIQVFSNEVGMTPKLYLRIARFERLLQGIFSQSSVNWAQAATEYGYFDQSHLIRDFRDFAEMTPSEYLSRRSEWFHAAHDDGLGH